TSLFLECGWQTHTLFYGEVSLCLGLKPFLFHQQSWWLSLAQATQNKKAMKSFDFTAFSGAMEGTRTPGLLIRRNRIAHFVHFII
ncbi:MAG: hypothetical protein U0M83_12125, partial [Faecalibacterium prausnitzii]